MSDSKTKGEDTKSIATGLVAVANKAWDEEVSAITLDDDIPCRPSPLTRQVACGVEDLSNDSSKIFVKRTIAPINQKNNE